MVGLMPKPLWRPDIIEDVTAIAQILMEYTSGTRAFVVYECGTAVFSDSAVGRLDQDYESTLVGVGHQPPDFKVVPMKSGNYLVRFFGPVCVLVIGEFFTKNFKEIKRELDKGGFLPGEKVVDIGQNPSPPDHYYIGLFARAKLYRDITDKVIAIRFVPQPE